MAFPIQGVSTMNLIKLGRATPIALSHLEHFVSRLGPNTQLQLVVEETLNSKTLEANFHIETQVVTAQQVGRFEHSHLTSSSTCSLPIPEPSSILGLHFGVAEMRNKVMDRMSIHPCYGRRVEIVTASSQSSSSPRIAWTGSCLLASSDLWNDPHIAGRFLPNLGEWILTCRDLRGENCCVELLRGSYSVLYSILCLVEKASPVNLTSSRPCFVCSTQIQTYFSLNADAKLDYGCLPMTMYSMMDTGPYTFELASFIQWTEDVTTDVEAAATKKATSDSQANELQLKHFYNSKRKQVLSGFLKRRDISIRKNTTKKEMILLLQEHDVQNSLAAAEDGFLENHNDDAMVLDD